MSEVVVKTAKTDRPEEEYGAKILRLLCRACFVLNVLKHVKSCLRPEFRNKNQPISLTRNQLSLLLTCGNIIFFL